MPKGGTALSFSIMSLLTTTSISPVFNLGFVSPSPRGRIFPSAIKTNSFLVREAIS